MAPGRQVNFSFAKPERLMKVHCNIHPWEVAYLSVVEHPFFAVTDTNGNFSLPELPPGNYTVEAQHRKIGSQSVEVEIKPDQNRSIEFAFELKNEQARASAK